jgi:hypothetical protein
VSFHLSLRRIPLATLDAAFQRARRDLREVGLLDDGRYLDRIDCVQALLPTLAGELGYVYDEGVEGLAKLVGFRPGVIYVPINAPTKAHVPGGTLLDTLRHEYAHAWAWLDRPFVRRAWFRETFGASYHADWPHPPEYDPSRFVSEYACTAPKEDFAETFMTFLRCRRSLHRFARRRPLHRKLLAVERAVAIAAKERAPSVRGPRVGS